MLLALSTCGLLWGCSQPDAPEPTPSDAIPNPAQSDARVSNPGTTAPASSLPDFGPVTARLQENWIDAHLNHLERQCDTLFEAVDRFLSDTSGTHQQQAQAAWHGCYLAWNQGLLLYQRGMDLNDSTALQQQRRRINVRPFLPGYIDALPEYPYSGLIHEAGLPLSLAVLEEQHQMLDLESAALGFPAVETLLWQTPVDRQWQDNPDPESPAARRRAYLRLASDDLRIQLQLSRQRWQPESLSALPDSVQVRWLWHSAERLVKADLLQFAFTEAATQEPQWHHPSWVAGRGRDHLQARLTPLQQLLAPDASPNPLRTWLNRAQLGLTGETLADQVDRSIAALQALPENYPTTPADIEPVRAELGRLAGLLAQITAGLDAP
jgi:hypothetical protein